MSVESVAPLDYENLKRRIMQFVHGASTEISTHDEPNLQALSQELPPGTTVYVAHTPKATLEEVVRVALKVQALGLRASPHIVARRISNEECLRTALRQLRSGGIEQVLLVAGDLPEPLGAYSSTLEILASGCLEREGISHIGVCGHPEGNRSIDPNQMWQALDYKQTYAQRAGLQLHIVTQFGFDPQAICAWEGLLLKRGIGLPVHVGIAGPTPLPKLIKFAMQCGVGTSLRSLLKNVGAVSKAARLATSPDEMVVGLIQSSTATTRLRQAHFFTFGGSIATAQWLRQVRLGEFRLPHDGGKFLLNS